jgi:hypothetical protein
VADRRNPALRSLLSLALLWVLSRLLNWKNMGQRNKFRKSVLSLPTNLEHATREYVQTHLASLDAKILARRAKRLGISVEEVANIDATPLFMVEIEARAAAEGRTVQLVLDEYTKRL